MDDVPKITLILVGEKGVGKTSFLRQFSGQAFKLQQKSTVLDFKKSSTEIDGKQMILEIWDTAGLEIYREISVQYYEKADGFILVYDVTNAETFSKLPSWLSKIRSLKEEAIIFLVGNKDENASRKVVKFSEVEEFAKQESLEFMEVSSLSGSCVKEAFSALVRKILQKKSATVFEKEEPDGSKPDDSKLSDPKSDDPELGHAKADDSKPDDSKPDDSKPDDSKPDDCKLNDPKPEDSELGHAKLEDSKQDDTKPDDHKSDDSKINNSKQEDSKTDYSKPHGSKIDNSKPDISEIDLSELEGFVFVEMIDIVPIELKRRLVIKT